MVKLVHTKTESIDTSILDDYLDQQDWRVKENSNVSYSFSGLMLHAAGNIIAKYTLMHYPNEIATAHKNADLHIHDLSMGIAGYCAGWSLKQLLLEGFNGVAGKTSSLPPKHLSTALGQMVNFLGTLQNEWAGAMAFSSFDTYLAPFVRADELSYDQVKQAVQSFVYGLNISSRWGGQCVSEDTQCLTDSGWKHYNDINLKKDLIATFNIETGVIEYLKPSRVKSYDYKGKLVRLSNRSQDQLVTPNHKVVRKVHNSDSYVLEEAQDLFQYKSPIIIPNSGFTQSKKEIEDEWVMLFAWLVSEGTFSEDRERVSIFQSTKNKAKLEQIRLISKKLGLRWDEQSRVHGFGTEPLVRLRFGAESSRTIRKKISSKKIPAIVKTLSARQIKLFIDTYVLGDGSIEKSGRMRIYTKDIDVLNDLQELCSLCLYGSTVYRRTNGVYVLNIIRNNHTYVKLSYEKYVGKVWCPTTKNGTFIARRNGKVFVTGNTPFTNVTLDWTVPEDMKQEPVILGGKYQKETYGQYQTEMDMINRAFLEVMIEGDMDGRIFTFPIPTYNITKEFDWDSQNANLLFEMTAKYGIPYFQNFINSSLKPSDVRSMCCRLQMDLRELKSKTGGLFGSGESTGSIGVVTINLPRIGFLAKDEDEFLLRLGKLTDLAYESLEVKRKMITQHLDSGLYPYTKRYLGSYANHFSTIGINGMNEAVLNLLGCTIVDPKGRAFALKVLDFLRDRLQSYQEESGNLYNLEATPAEGTAYRFARHDKRLYPQIITQGTIEPYYTNSTQLPVDQTDDLFEALDLQDELQCKYTGGTVFHGFLGESMSDVQACKKLVKQIAYSYKMPYFTITPTFSICPGTGFEPGEVSQCPKTQQPCDIYSRVVGYFRPVQQWNKGKSAEYQKRKEYVAQLKNDSAQTHIQSWNDIPDQCILLTLSGCPSCPGAKDALQNQSLVPHTVIDASTPQGREMAKLYAVEKVPTAIFMDAQKEIVAKISGTQQIQAYVQELSR
ncbi:MAG: ribonucleoside triphosphate reductase [Candidatus Woesearchaeota archaeon]